jgi:hypothetical protein
MDPYTLHLRWYPAKDTYHKDSLHPEREGIEGFYLLHSLPHIDGKKPIPASAFAPLSAKKCFNCVAEIRTRMAMFPQTVAVWEAWYQRFAPHTDNVKDYLVRLKEKQLPFRVPMRSFLLNSTWKNIFLRWDKPMLDVYDKETDPGFQWPTLLAAAMPSVVSRFNLHPPEPRLFVVEQLQLERLLSRYQLAVETFYTDPRLTKSKALELLALKVDAAGSYFPVSGIKITTIL